jgi:hypothetical protein
MTMDDDTQDKGVLAVDFGTSNTYLSKCPADQSTPMGIDFGRGRDGIASAILYRDGKAPIIGDIALEEFGDATDSEREAYRIRTQFKPDIADSERARDYARDFLASLLRDAEQQNIALQLESRQVIFGVPSEAGEVWRDTLKTLVKLAGYGDIQVVDEPKGAIYFHVQRKDITPLEATDGALVVDFGGGTCDFALVVHGEVKHSWGDMHLGGRLFDDVFFQWLVEQNPDAIEDMRDEHAEFFVLWFLCREVKEKFSQAMALDRTGTFRKKVDAYGRISDVTWEGFLARIRDYRPSATFLDYMREINPQAVAKVSAGEGIDILQWFRESLREGLQHPNANGHPIACIILTGGSSSWPFVAEIVAEEMAAIGMEPRLVRSDKPYATIAEGLAIIPSLQRHFARVKERLRQDVPLFLHDQVEPLIQRRMQEVAKRIAASIAVPLFDERIGPILVEFREQGGSVASLKQRIATQAELFEPQIAAIVEEQVGRTLKALPADVDELLRTWFQQHDLVYRRSSSELSGGSASGAIRLDSIDVYGDIENIIGLISVGIITTLVAAISGGAGTALIASGPLGLFLGAVIGLIGGGLVVRYGLDEAKRKAENWEGCPLWILQKALSDKKIAKVREDIIEQIQKKVIEQVGEAKAQLEQQIRRYVDEEIESLSAINQV